MPSMKKFDREFIGGGKPYDELLFETKKVAKEIADISVETDKARAEENITKVKELEEKYRELTEKQQTLLRKASEMKDKIK